ncbi:hypothetical protein NDU88_012063 [Pleurodeles waltl]|uniref:Uncharacterized protein n=1 Tax=Pleurodeles waltl TaxID=8319 RepID=A0AAV7S310_PLEWA|nr:hypothetical protein NDU88_012063 [Pleurodeles waltl]
MWQSTLRQLPGPAQEALKHSGTSTHMGLELWSIPATRWGAPGPMGLLRSFICRFRGPLPSQPECPAGPVSPHFTAHQALSSLEVITRPNSGSPLILRRGHRYRSPSVTATRRSTRPVLRNTARRAAAGPVNS